MSETTKVEMVCPGCSAVMTGTVVPPEPPWVEGGYVWTCPRCREYGGIVRRRATEMVISDVTPEGIVLTTTPTIPWKNGKTTIASGAPFPPALTKAEKYREKQRARAAAAKDRAALDRAVEVIRRGNEREKNPPLDEARIEEKRSNLGRMPNTPETEDLARRMNVGRMFDQYQVAEAAIGRATYRAMAKGKIVADRETRAPGEVELPPAVRAMRERLKIRGKDGKDHEIEVES